MGFLFHPWVLLGALALCGAAAATAPVYACTVALVWVTLFLLTAPTSSAPDRRRSWFAWVGLACVALSWYRASSELDDFRERYQQTRLSFQEPLRCAGEGEITRSPVLRTRWPDAAKSSPQRPKNEKAQDGESLLLFQAQFSELDCEGTIVPGPIQVRLASPPAALGRGDRFSVVAQLAPPRLFRNAGLPNPWMGAARSGAVLSGSALALTPISAGKGMGALIDQYRSTVRARIDATYSKISAPLGRALVLGESDLPGQDAEAFRHSGLLHLLAVSGTHLVIFVLSFVRLLRALLIRIEALASRFDPSRWSSGSGALMSLAYADFSGGSGSAWRAAYMLCAVCGARALGLRMSGPTALGLSLLVGVAVDPFAPGDYSFLLSALATAGLMGLGQPLTRLVVRGWSARAPFRFLLESLCATLASTVACTPLLAMMSGKMTWAALLANVVAAPLGEIIALPACLLHAVVPFLPALESGLALLGAGALYGVRTVALLSAGATGAQFEVPFPSAAAICWGITGGLVLIHLLDQALRHRALGTWIGIGAFLFAFFIGAHSTSGRRAGSGSLYLTALDVGQGDALVAQPPQGGVFLIDGGGFALGRPDTGTRVVLPYLRSQGYQQVDLMVLSHPHPDHISGLISTAEQIPVKELWIPSGHPQVSPQMKRKKNSLGRLIAAVQAKGGQIRTSASLCEGVQTLKGLAIEVLAPCTLGVPPLGLNDDSLVLRLRYGKRTVLLTGDIEEAGERRLLAQKRDRLRADLLKVAHHGSDTSSQPAFINAVSPRYAFIASGVRNRFRHPRPKTLSTLERHQVDIFRTDQQGSLTFWTDGNQVQIRSFDPPVRPLPPSRPQSASGVAAAPPLLRPPAAL